MIYTGIREVNLTDEELSEFYTTKNLEMFKDLLNNEYILIKNKDGEVYKLQNKKLIRVNNIKFKGDNVLKPLDDIQLCAYDMLVDNNIKVACLIGKSGTGKTKTAISIGLELLKNNKFEKLILIRHAEETGKSIGLLPGSKDEKMISGWAGCFIDNLPGGKYEFEILIRNGQIEIESLSLLKGRNFKRSLIIFDEAEDADVNHIEIIGSRLNDDCKMIFVGDYCQVSVSKYKQNSGLLKLIDKAKGNEWFGVVELKTNGRGKVAEFFATDFKNVDEKKES